MIIAKRITNLTSLRQQRITERIWLRYASSKFALRANFRYARDVRRCENYHAVNDMKLLKKLMLNLIGSSLFCMGDSISLLSAEADYRRGVMNAERPQLSKSPRFYNQG